jgi:ureidoacrylate peracid hydrolase
MTSRQTVSIEGRPGPISIDPRETAVIVVDMQNDFGSEGGLFGRAGIDIAPIKAVVEPTAKVIATARRSGIHVIYLKMEFRPGLSDLGNDESANALRHRFFGVGECMVAPDGSEGRFLVRGTWNTEIVDELKPEPGDVVVSKHRFSGFFGTDLEIILKTLGVRNLVFTGCTTSVCVESTLRDAFFRDYRCVLLEDCTAEPIGSNTERTNYEATLLLIERLFGWVSDSAAFARALEPQTVLTST